MIPRPSIAFSGALFVLLTATLGETFRPYMSVGEAGSSEEITNIQVGQCVEESKKTHPDSECGAPPSADCPTTKVTKIFNLGISGGVIVTVSGGIQYQYDVSTGCKFNDYPGRENCKTIKGIQWSAKADGPVAAADETECPEFRDNMICVNKNRDTTIEIPPNIIQEIIAKFKGKEPKNNSFTFKEVVCEINPDSGEMNTCPGTNGGQTWYYKSRKTPCPATTTTTTTPGSE